MAGETFALILTSFHDGCTATTAIHQTAFPRHIGGARFVPRAKDDGTIDGLAEVAHLASTMTDKCMAAMIAADGQKSVILSPANVMASEARRARVLAEHVALLRDLDGGVIVGPDMNNPEAVQDRAAEGLLDHFTGLSSSKGGLSIDANGYTATGLAEAVRVCLDGRAFRLRRVSIQGFGAVGAHAARLLHGMGLSVVAVANRHVCVAAASGRLDIPTLFRLWLDFGDDGLTRYAAALPASCRAGRPEAIFSTRTDIFLPAARTAVLASKGEMEKIRQEENPDVRDVAEFHRISGVRLVVEGANHPLSLAAERWLEGNGVRILPDYIVNCGGLIGCWMEWEERHGHVRSGDIDLGRLGNRALRRIRETVLANVRELLNSGLPARDAAAQIVRRNRAVLRARGGTAGSRRP